MIRITALAALLLSLSYAWADPCKSGLAPNQRPGVVVSRRGKKISPLGAPTDDQMVGDIKEAKRTNAEREQTREKKDFLHPGARMQLALRANVKDTYRD